LDAPLLIDAAHTPFMQADDAGKGLHSINIYTSAIDRQQRVGDRKGRAIFAVNNQMDLRQALPKIANLFD
jgi:hypothetical protein